MVDCIVDLADEISPNLYSIAATDHPTAPNSPLSPTSPENSAPPPSSRDETPSRNVQAESTAQEVDDTDPIESTVLPALATGRRRRRSSSSEVTLRRDASSYSQSQTELGTEDTGSPGREEPRSPSRPSAPKRRRLMTRNMRRDSENSLAHHGSRNHVNGYQKRPSPASLNGHTYANGGQSLYPNGTRGESANTEFYGHNREEVARLMIQALSDLGYHKSSDSLQRESGFELESPSVSAFRDSITKGEWSEAESLLFGQENRSEGGVRISNGHPQNYQGLPLAEGSDRDELRFQLRRQKYLELLEQQDHAGALMVLRHELTPLHRDVGQLHVLSGLMVCPSAEDLRTQAGWDGAQGSSRSSLLIELSKSISPSVMIPEHRLATLLTQLKQSQLSKCHYHNPTSPMSLFADHICDKNQFPLQTIHELPQRDEVWYLEFSHDGTRLATCGQDSRVIIYDTATFQEVHILTEHTKFVAFLAWSPDDSKLVTCSNDKSAKLWDAITGHCMYTIQNHNEPVTAASWTPSGQAFITGSLDKESSLNMWSEKAERVYTWPSNYRINALAVSPDGARLVTLSDEPQIHVYNLHTREEEYSLRLKASLTSVTITRDSKYMLVNMADSELQLIDINTAEIFQRFLGQKQGDFVIRSTFGGADENLVISGSEGTFDNTRRCTQMLTMVQIVKCTYSTRKEGRLSRRLMVTLAEQ